MVGLVVGVSMAVSVIVVSDVSVVEVKTSVVEGVGITGGACELMTVEEVVSAEGVSVSELVALSVVETKTGSSEVVGIIGGMVELVGIETVEYSEESLLMTGGL
jgi:hypothetical protein